MVPTLRVGSNLQHSVPSDAEHRKLHVNAEAWA